MTDPVKPWQNQNPDDKNLESLKNGFTLENIMGSNVMTTVPTLSDIGEGQFRMVLTGGNLYKYTRVNNQIYLQPWVAV